MVKFIGNTQINKNYIIPLLSMAVVFSLSGCGSSNKKEVVETADTTAPVVSLVGEDTVIVAHNGVYEELGANASDDVDGTVSVTTSGEVDSTTVGSYSITYTAVDAAGNQGTQSRTVNVTDQTSPMITLNGSSSMTIFQGADYDDAMAVASDIVDGELVVTTTGSVDTATLGDYVITYTAVDAAGNEAMVTRTVTVDVAMLSGTAAAGAAIIGTVTVKGALGMQKSQLIEADGSYDVDVTGLTPPFRLRAQGTVGGKNYQLHSYSEAATVGGTVNITPFTDLIIANAAHQLASNFFESADDTSIEASELVAQENALQEKLQDVFTALGVDAAINLLNSSFSADHSGVDAALDVIQIENTSDSIVTITNLIDGSSITDDITATDDNDTALTADPESLQQAVTDTQAIANLFSMFGDAFAQGLPSAESISPIFASDFLEEDNTLGEFLTDITTDPSMIGISFISVSISDLDVENNSAAVSFNVVIDGEIDHETINWFAAKDLDLGWQLRGDQRIADIDELDYHCNDYDGTDEHTGGCGINVSVYDENFTNNGTDGAAIKSAMVHILDGDDQSTIKATIYLGNPEYSASELHIYNREQHNYTGDYLGFGDTVGTIDPSVFSIGDIIEYNLFVAELDLTDADNPTISGDALVSYYGVVEHEPATVGLYPVASEATIAAVNSFATWPDGQDLTIEWTVAEGTVIDEILVELSGSEGNYSQYWDDGISATDTSVTVDSSLLDTELFNNGSFDFSQGYSFAIRIYARDTVTGQYHSTDYRVHVPAVDDGITPPPTETPVYNCDYDSGWDDVAELPLTLDSFDSFLTVVDDCGGAMTVVAANFAGSSFVDDGETQTFNDDGQATESNPSTGMFNDGDGEMIDFQWYVEIVDGNSYVIVYTDSTIDTDLDEGFELRDTMAITAINGNDYTVRFYSEQSNFDGADMIRTSGADGEIWGTVFTKQ